MSNRKAIPVTASIAFAIICVIIAIVQFYRYQAAVQVKRFFAPINSIVLGEGGDSKTYADLKQIEISAATNNSLSDYEVQRLLQIMLNQSSQQYAITSLAQAFCWDSCRKKHKVMSDTQIQFLAENCKPLLAGQYGFGQKVECYLICKAKEPDAVAEILPLTQSPFLPVREYADKCLKKLGHPVEQEGKS